MTHVPQLAEMIRLTFGDQVMRLTITTFLPLLIASASAARAQAQAPAHAPAQPPAQPRANPLSGQAKYLQSGIKMILLQSAERMPAEHYAFKPTDDVRTYGQIVAHLADMQYTYCAAVLGEKDPDPRIEETKASKAELVPALKQALAYCDRAVDGMTDAAGSTPARFMGAPVPKLALLEVANMHSMLHYGNLVTYMRMKHIVPPTSDSTLMPPGTVHPLPKHPPQP